MTCLPVSGVCVSFLLYPSCPPPVGLLTWTISTEVKPFVAEARFLILILFKVISATSARSSASSSSWMVFLYLDRLLLACSSYSGTDEMFVLVLNKLVLGVLSVFEELKESVLFFDTFLIFQALLGFEQHN